jgi:hypothetical protein
MGVNRCKQRILAADAACQPINNVKNDGPELLLPISLPVEQPLLV